MLHHTGLYSGAKEANVVNEELSYIVLVGNCSIAAIEECAVVSDGAHWLFFSALCEGVCWDCVP